MVDDDPVEELRRALERNLGSDWLRSFGRHGDDFHRQLGRAVVDVLTRRSSYL